MSQQITIDQLKIALRSAILSTHRVQRKCIDYDPAGSTYEVDWTAEVKGWAWLCDLDLDEHDPAAFDQSLWEV